MKYIRTDIVESRPDNAIKQDMFWSLVVGTTLYTYWEQHDGTFWRNTYEYEASNVLPVEYIEATRQ